MLIGRIVHLVTFAPVRRSLVALLIAVSTIALLGVNPAAAHTRGAIMIDYDTGRVLTAVNADVPNHPASLTKMMTLYLLFDALEKGRVHLHDAMPVSVHASRQAPSKLGLSPGQTITVEQGILGLVTKSANDAAVVIAEYLGGTEPAFAALMTKKAHELGMQRTMFHNASGLPIAGQWSTPRDMATLAHALIKNHATEYHYFSTREFDYQGETIASHNHLLGSYQGADGIKTGYIASSGFNLVASAKRNGHRLIGVVFGGNTQRDRDHLMVALLDAGFAREGNAPAIATAKADTLPQAEEDANASAPQTEAEAEDPQVNAVIQAMANPHPATAPVSGPVPAAAKQVAVLAKPGVPAVQAAPATDADANESAGDAEEQPYGIQLGSFGRRAAAVKLADNVVARLGDLVADGHAEVAFAKAHRSTLYRALVVGLAESDAQRACKALRHHRLPCRVIKTDTIHLASR